jgi:hypothetical protein
MSNIKLFESKKIRSTWSDAEEKWYFSIIDVIEVLTNSKLPKRYWSDLKTKLKSEGSEVYEKIVRLKMLALLTNIIHQEWSGLSVKSHKNIKKLKSQNLRDHMSEAELIFTALAELSTRQIAETEEAKGLIQNAIAGKKGGKIAKDARVALEEKTGIKVVTGENFLPPSKAKKKLT